ncbi:MAG TPA: heme NO-binding domain-containing protein [Thermoguttaceae bacterium]|nr:heme NO-binding domain-containing protein [Thermoguttaceae bacterium]
MKGVVNKGIQELVEERFGEDTWDEIRSAADCDEPSFSPSLDYPDQMTVDLVTATARCLGLSPDETMVEFGKYWVSNTGKESYPSLYALAGANPRDFLRNMDRIHRHATVSISGARPPSLRAEDLPDGGLALHYDSERKLCPVLHGLILGVGLYFEQTLAVEEVRCMRNGDPECVFEVRFP